jgi:hypothetical protein
MRRVIDDLNDRFFILQAFHEDYEYKEKEESWLKMSFNITASAKLIRNVYQKGKKKLYTRRKLI